MAQLLTPSNPSDDACAKPGPAKRTPQRSEALWIVAMAYAGSSQACCHSARSERSHPTAASHIAVVAPNPSVNLSPPNPVRSAPITAIVAPPSLNEMRQQAHAAWLQRADRSSLERAIALWEQVAAQDPNDGTSTTALTRAYFFLADGHMRTSGENDAIIQVYERGVQAGERAVLAQSPEFAARVKAGDRIEDALSLIPGQGQAALYWYASNLARFAWVKGFTTILFYKDRILAVMQRVLSIDETFYYGAPHRYLGAYLAKVPSFAGGDLKKAKEHFEAAIRINNRFFATKVLYAELYAIRAEDRALFTRLLTEVRDGDAAALADVVPEQKIEQDKAQKLLSQADDLF